MKAIAEACQAGVIAAMPRLVISNNSGAVALERAKLLGLAGHHMSGKTHPGEGVLDEAICSLLESEDIDLVVLSGYMRKIGPQTLACFKGRILNVHPALLPKFGGKGFYGNKVHQAVLDAGEEESGATIHLVDGEYDTGPTLLQGRVPVLPDDTVETLAARVMDTELKIFVDALRKIASGEIKLEALR